MRLFVKFVLLGIVGVCSVVLSGCSFIWTTENGDPATPEDIKSSVEKEFSVVHPNLVLQSSVVEKEKPFQRNVYVFYDESNGISFTTNSVVKCQHCRLLVASEKMMRILRIHKRI